MGTYGLIHQQGVDPMSGTPFEQCMPWDMVMSFDDLQAQICSYAKPCGRNIPCPDAFPGYGMCDCYESTWDMPEKVYALHNSGVPGLVVIEPEAPPSDFDDDWMPASLSSRASLTFLTSAPPPRRRSPPRRRRRSSPRPSWLRTRSCASASACTLSARTNESPSQ